MKPLLPTIKPGSAKLPAKPGKPLNPIGAGLKDRLSGIPQYFPHPPDNGGENGDLADRLRARAREELPRFKMWADFGAQLCRDLGKGERARRFLQEVLNPLQKQQLDGRTALARTNDVFGCDVLANARSKAPFSGGVTIAIGIGAAIGAGLGYEKCYGIAFTGFATNLRTFEYWSRSLHAGTVELSVSASVEFSLGAPEPKLPGFLEKVPALSQKQRAGWDGWGAGWAFGGGWGATVSTAVGFGVTAESPEMWDFKSFAVQVGGGGGADLGMWLQGTAARELTRNG